LNRGPWVGFAAVLGMAALFYAIVGDAGCGTPPALDAGVLPDAAVFAKPKALPPIELPKLEPDAGYLLDESEMTLELVKRWGIIGRDEKWVGEILADDPHWKPISSHDDRAVWRNGNNVEVSFMLERGRVAGLSAAFPENSFSADLTALSWLVMGNRDALPMHWEEFEAHQGEPRNGTFELDDGRIFNYRGRVRTKGQDPWGPELFEVRTTPFPR
jgi:hypothetical protein